MNRRHCLAFLLGLPTLAVAQQPSSPVSDGPIERLRPGQYLWAPQVAPDGPVTMIVSLPAQRAYIYRNGVPIGVSTVSTGRKGHETPTGLFTILQKDADHHSSLYDDAAMPFMQRLTWDGIALHAGNLPGYPASHGCVRLPLAFAKLLYGVTRVGLTVIITGDALVPEIAPAAPAVIEGRGGPDGPYDWHPERSPAGPVSILVSGRDRRLVVLRGGVEIGSAPIAPEDPIAATAAYSLRAIDADGLRWLRLPLPGTPSAAGTELSADDRARARLPEPFVRALEAILHPGATLLVTRDSLASGGTGTRMRVVEVDRGDAARR